MLPSGKGNKRTFSGLAFFGDDVEIFHAYVTRKWAVQAHFASALTLKLTQTSPLHTFSSSIKAPLICALSREESSPDEGDNP